MYKYKDCLQYIPDLTRYIKQKIKTDDYKDILQDTLLYIYINFENKKITNLKGYMFNACRFFILKYFRDRNKQVIYSGELNITNTAIINLCGYNSIELDDKLLNSIKSIDKKYLKPFELQLTGYSLSEISKELCLNINTVKTRINRCKIKLKSTYHNN
jgi:RNA polymerase sigma-70 factor (ECF subfamily)